jgi:hypothetical protein
MDCFVALLLAMTWRERRDATVIASEAKQSMVPRGDMDCFVASLLAMTIPENALMAGVVTDFAGDDIAE